MIKEFMFQNPTISLIILSLVITFVTKIITKFTTDQSKLKSIREETKELQKKMKEALKKKDTKAYDKLQTRSLQLSQQQMQMSMKSLMYTFLPIILLFGLLRSNIANESLNIGDNLDIEIKLKEIKEVEIISKNNFSTKDTLPVENNSNMIIPKTKIFTINLENIQFDENITIKTKNSSENIEIKTSKFETTDMLTIYKFKESDFSSAKVLLNEKIYFNFLFLKLNWFWTYFILAMIFNTLLTKLLKIY
ncbi:MAG: EMC3/TMCO1 family protein [Candidatus Nanoarchaeia archaeon]|nr:EMC3/TMCO1 family protein [Candidatus Nanoarchaeia archaeon]